MPARGVLIARADHPEWRQLLVNAALRRADELSQLRQLPDTPTQGGNTPADAKNESPQRADEVAGVPANQIEAQPEDVTGTVVQSPNAAIAVDIGEASSTELPLAPQEERPPAILTPERGEPPRESLSAATEPAKPAQDESKVTPEPEKSPSENQRKTVRHSQRARVAARTREFVRLSLLEAFFASFYIDQRASKPRR
jgi:hypothetical protein